MPGGVIAAGGAREQNNAQEHRPDLRGHAPGARCTRVTEFSLGARLAAMLSAHSTAVAAAMRRLSAAAHSQTPCGGVAIRGDRDQDVALAGGIHVAGRLFRQAADRHMLAGQRLGRGLSISASCSEFDVNRKGVPWKMGACSSSSEGTGASLPAICR